MMKPRNKPLRALGLILFFAGILLGMGLFGSSVWADLESNFYFGYGVKGNKTVNLSCPPMLTVSDSKSFTAYIHNTTDRLVEPSIQTDISNILAVRSDRTKISVAANQTVPVSWQLTTDDVVFGHLILVHVFQFPAFVLPSADANCGIVFLNLTGVTGMQVFILALLGTLLGIAGGLTLWGCNSRLLEGHIRQQMLGMVFLSVIVAVGLLLSWVGWWGPGVLVFTLASLMVIILLARYVLEPGQP
jgi:hypothetical protein